MSTDRELLELAARGAGIAVECSVVGGIERLYESGSLQPWDPLAFSDDALELAAKLGISVSYSHSTGLDVPYPAIIEVGAFAGWCPTYTEVNRDDWPAATRRAIVRAAAEIGRAT